MRRDDPGGEISQKPKNMTKLSAQKYGSPIEVSRRHAPIHVLNPVHGYASEPEKQANVGLPHKPSGKNTQAWSPKTPDPSAVIDRKDPCRIRSMLFLFQIFKRCNWLLLADSWCLFTLRGLR